MSNELKIQRAITRLENLLKESTAPMYRQPFSSSDISKTYAQGKLQHLERECFLVIYLTNQHELIESHIESMGTIDQAPVYPREIAKRALQHNAAAVILAHNHPSGCKIVSEADMSITTAITDALRLLQIRVLDHLIVPKGSIYCVSMAETGQL